MIPVPSGVRVYLSTGATDMRKGMPGLSLLVQEALGRDPMPAICMSLGAVAVISSRFFLISRENHPWF